MSEFLILQTFLALYTFTIRQIHIRKTTNNKPLQLIVCHLSDYK